MCKFFPQIVIEQVIDSWCTSSLSRCDRLEHIQPKSPFWRLKIIFLIQKVYRTYSYSYQLQPQIHFYLQFSKNSSIFLQRYQFCTSRIYVLQIICIVCVCVYIKIQLYFSIGSRIWRLKSMSPFRRWKLEDGWRSLSLYFWRFRGRLEMLL